MHNSDVLSNRSICGICQCPHMWVREHELLSLNGMKPADNCVHFVPAMLLWTRRKAPTQMLATEPRQGTCLRSEEHGSNYPLLTTNLAACTHVPTILGRLQRKQPEARSHRMRMHTHSEVRGAPSLAIQGFKGWSWFRILLTLTVLLLWLDTRLAVSVLGSDGINISLCSQPAQLCLQPTTNGARKSRWWTATDTIRQCRKQVSLLRVVWAHSPERAPHSILTRDPITLTQVGCLLHCSGGEGATATAEDWHRPCWVGTDRARWAVQLGSCQVPAWSNGLIVIEDGSLQAMNVLAIPSAPFGAWRLTIIKGCPLLVISSLSGLGLRVAGSKLIANEGHSLPELIALHDPCAQDWFPTTWVGIQPRIAVWRPHEVRLRRRFRPKMPSPSFRGWVFCSLTRCSPSMPSGLAGVVTPERVEGLITPTHAPESANVVSVLFRRSHMTPTTARDDGS